MSNCYLCARDNATNPLDLPKSFTNHSAAKSPYSDKLCDRCYGAIAGNEKQLWYWNPNKNAWSKVWGRGLSRLYQCDKLLCPIIEGEREGLQIVKNLATREQIRCWLLDPPQPPFTIAIAVTGQKHVLPFAIEGLDRERFPVQFETESIGVTRSEFAKLLNKYQELMALGFSKSEITSGHYRSDRVISLDCAQRDRFMLLDREMIVKRGSSSLLLVEHVA
jgi:hypothetical protein